MKRTSWCLALAALSTALVGCASASTSSAAFPPEDTYQITAPANPDGDFLSRTAADGVWQGHSYDDVEKKSLGHEVCNIIVIDVVGDSSGFMTRGQAKDDAVSKMTTELGSGDEAGGLLAAAQTDYCPQFL